VSPFSNLSLTQRLLLTILAPLVLLWAATTALFLVYGTEALATTTRERGLAIVSLLAPTANYGIVSGNRSDLDQILQAALEQDGVATAAVFDHAGAVVSMRGQPELLEWVTLTTTRSPQLLLEHPGRLAFAAPVRMNEIALGQFSYARSEKDLPALAATPIGWVYVELDTRPHEQQNWNFVLIASLVALAILSLTAIPAIRLARNVGTPVARLADAVNHLAEGELDVAIPVGGTGRELQTLERSLNTVAASIASAHQTMRTRIDEATAHLSYQALHDPLTGLLNRRAFEAALEEAVSASRRAADHGTLCFIDLAPTPLSLRLPWRG
jgi:methyl-accepting chemotaxis protein